MYSVPPLCVCVHTCTYLVSPRILDFRPLWIDKESRLCHFPSKVNPEELIGGEGEGRGTLGERGLGRRVGEVSARSEWTSSDSNECTQGVVYNLSCGSYNCWAYPGRTSSPFGAGEWT